MGGHAHHHAERRGADAISNDFALPDGFGMRLRLRSKQLLTFAGIPASREGARGLNNRRNPRQILHFAVFILQFSILLFVCCESEKCKLQNANCKMGLKSALNLSRE